MKSILFKLSITTLLLIMFHNVNAQIHVIVQYTDNSEISYSLDSLGKLYFSDQNFIIAPTLAIEETIDVTNIRKIYFLPADEYLGISTYSENSKISPVIYPNPSSDYIKFSNIEENTSIDIYSIDGKLILQDIISSNTSINISHLQKGIYVVNIANKIFKFCKL